MGFKRWQYTGADIYGSGAGGTDPGVADVKSCCCGSGAADFDTDGYWIYSRRQYASIRRRIGKG